MINFAHYRKLVCLFLVLVYISLGSSVKNSKRDNQPPVLNADEFTVLEDSATTCWDVFANDKDIDGTIIFSTLAVETLPNQKGVASLMANSSGYTKICYKPASNFWGIEVFSYSAVDINGKEEDALVTVNVLPVNDAPEVAEDFVIVSSLQDSVLVDVLKNDKDQDGPSLNPGSLQVMQQPCHGYAEVTSDHRILYTPDFEDDERFRGEDKFAYQVCDTAIPPLCR